METVGGVSLLRWITSYGIAYIPRCIYDVLFVCTSTHVITVCNLYQINKMFCSDKLIKWVHCVILGNTASQYKNNSLFVLIY